MPKFSSEYSRSVAVRHKLLDGWRGEWVSFLLADASAVKCYRHGSADFWVDNSDTKTLDCIVQLDINLRESIID